MVIVIKNKTPKQNKKTQIRHAEIKKISQKMKRTKVCRNSNIGNLHIPVRKFTSLFSRN